MKLLRFSFPYLCKLSKNCIILKCKRYSYSTSRNIWKHPISLITPWQCTFISSCKFHASLSKNAKHFQERENEYAHEVMVNLPVYSNTLLRYPLQISCLKQSDIHRNVFDNFVNATACNIHKGSSLENLEYCNLVKNICTSLSQASDDEIQNTLLCLCMWPPTPHTTTRNFKLLWNALDGECTKRLKNWDVSHKLLISDYWFYLKLSRISRYNTAVINDLIQNIETLTNHQIIQLMFLINLQRTFPISFGVILEQKLPSVIDSVTVEELGIICMAYFKTKSKISNPEIINLIIKKFIDNIEFLNTVTIASFLKFLRKSLHLPLIELYIYVMHKCVPYLNNMDIPTSVHLAILSSICNVYHPLLLNSVADKLAKQISEARLKDCTKLLQCLSNFNHYPEGNFHELHIAEFSKNERQDEIASYPRDIIYSLLYYAYIGHFNYVLLAKIFEKTFIEMSCLKYDDIFHNFIELDYCIEIECPDYTGPRLDVSERKLLEKRRGNLPHTSTSNMKTKLFNNVYECLIEILGSDKNILIRHILPHIFSPDIIVRLFSKNNKTLSELCDKIPSDCILKPPMDEVWACFVLCNSFSLAYKSKQIHGRTAMKLRQLEKIGYNIVYIPFYKLPLSASHRKQYLKGKLDSLEEGNIKQHSFD